jgi:acyl transferase domain-containing protein
LSTTSEPLVEGIAIIGAVGRFPGADDLVQFWANLQAGVESVSTFTDAQLAAAGFAPAQLRQDPRYVPVRGVVERAEWFDAPFFGFTPREAQLTDPQHRLFLEAAWEALETAGSDPARSKGTIGVFAGCGNNTWARRYFARDLDELESGEWLESAIGNEKDYVATRVAYKLNLRGPAVNVNTACSTSLVAVCQACQALWTYQCDVALAGGVNVTFPQTRGYRPRHCRPETRFRGTRRRRRDLGGHPRRGNQQRWRRKGELHRAERRWPGRSHRARASNGGSFT